MKNLTILIVTIVFMTTNLSKINAQITGSFTDSRDGKTYKTIKIGTQTWMAENLAYKTSSDSWAYNNNDSNVVKYGRLYNWEAAKNACPKGWHLPSDAEWTKLTDYLGGEKVAGKKLKSANGWELYRGKNYGNNVSGFSALPGGYRDGHYGPFRYMGEYSCWWSNTPNGSELTWYRSVGCGYNGVGRDFNYRSHGYSVRCLKN